MVELSAEEQQKKVIDNSEIPLKRGDTWYVIPRNWWVTFSQYCGLNPNKPSEESERKGSKPGKIDYGNILEENKRELIKELIEHHDYELVHSSIYKDLKSWGYTSEVSIPRSVIARGQNNYPSIELYPYFISVCRAKDKKILQRCYQKISYHESIYNILQKNYRKDKNMEDEKDEKEEETKEGETEDQIPGRVHYLSMEAGNQGWKLLNDEELHQRYIDLENGYPHILLDFKNDGKWDWHDTHPDDELTEHRKFIENLAEGNHIDVRSQFDKWYVSEVLEIQEDLIKIHYTDDPLMDEEIPKTSNRLAQKGKHTNSQFSRGNAHSCLFQRQNKVGAPDVRGAVGLRNLGNTCFMNSTLQCLSNTPGLTNFFRNDVYKNDLNTTNRLGCKGRVANAYADLIKEIWSNKFKVVAPVNFKRVIGDFQPQFSGYQQHDSSELLGWLMDGLHEDLNRVLDKPQTEQVESKGRDDAVVAKEAWERHLKRNQSIIVDLCQGQLKSTVVCPDCSKQSITFDPYMFLSVPLPQANTKSIQVTYKSLADGPMVYCCMVSKQLTSLQVRESLSKIVGGGVMVANLVMKEVYHSQFWKEFKPTEQVVENDENWLYQIPENTKHFQLLHKNSMGQGIQTPTLIAIPNEKISEFPMIELRRLIKDCISPFLKGGWQQDDNDEKMYTIGIYSPSNTNSTLTAEIPYNLEEINLDVYPHGSSLGIRWTQDSENRFQEVEEWPKHKSVEAVMEEKNKSLTLCDCFAEFTKKETLAESDAWYCSQCKAHKCAEKKIDLFSVPEVLIIHLKRFHYDQYLRNKIDTMIDFPIEGLDMTQWMLNKGDQTKVSCVYDLFAVSNHMGHMGGGHYTAFSKSMIDKKWYHLDDSSVQAVENAKTARTSNAYVLFYQRRQT